jgi:hypothetical protein
LAYETKEVKQLRILWPKTLLSHSASAKINHIF